MRFLHVSQDVWPPKIFGNELIDAVKRLCPVILILWALRASAFGRDGG